MGIIGSIIIDILAGFLAGKIMRGGYGCFQSGGHRVGQPAWPAVHGHGRCGGNPLRRLVV